MRCSRASFLLKRSRLPLTRALERVGGIQSQYAPSTYIGLWSRLEGFRLADSDPCPRALARDPGDADAVDDPRLGGRLLAARRSATTSASGGARAQALR